MAGVDGFTPPEIARLVETKGAAKVNARVSTMLVLAVLAGAFIGLGGVLSTVATTGSSFGYGPTKILGGFVFSLGLILVIVAGAELFTGNTLALMSVVDGHVSSGRLVRHWVIVYFGNLIGALSIVAMVYVGEWWTQADHAVGAQALTIAAGKASLPFTVVFVRGILANALVCLAVWLAAGGRSVTDKIMGIVFPITAFVAAGFEHSIANMYFLPIGLLLSDKADVVTASELSPAQLASLDGAGIVRNIAAATLGNIVGGAVLVGLVYWFVYLRSVRTAD
ncbi:MAG: formate/nitrite transporter family protein [Actinomycetota bacterium]